MQGYLIFLASFGGAAGLAWLARDLIFGRPPAENQAEAAGQDELKS